MATGSAHGRRRLGELGSDGGGGGGNVTDAWIRTRAFVFVFALCAVGWGGWGNTQGAAPLYYKTKQLTNPSHRPVCTNAAAEFPTSIPGQFIAALDASHDAAVNVTALADRCDWGSRGLLLCDFGPAQSSQTH
jgi:hypothetical protein